MCTVSFIPVRDRIYITSNRDEKISRPPAIFPKVNRMASGAMIFPIDAESEGSWIALCENGNAGVLLNGAFEKHQRKSFYAKSRGLIFLDIMDCLRPVHQFWKMPLQGIEPFTLVIWQQNNLYDCRLDEHGKKYCVALENYRYYIWSSSTLCDEATRKKREYLFLKWLNSHPVPHRNDILDFHSNVGIVGRDRVIVQSAHAVSTVSKTNIEITPNDSGLFYEELNSNKSISCQFDTIPRLSAA